MNEIILSILLGLLPEVFYFIIMIYKIKSLNNKKIKLFILTALTYLICIILIKYQLLFYVIFIFVFYFILKKLYKTEIEKIDIFIIMYLGLYLTLLSFLIYLPKNNLQYYICYAIDRVFLFIPLLFINKIKLAYKKYCFLWNRNDKTKRKIKSITLRNISIFVMNFIIFLIYIISLYILSNAR